MCMGNPRARLTGCAYLYMQVSMNVASRAKTAEKRSTALGYPKENIRQHLQFWKPSVTALDFFGEEAAD